MKIISSKMGISIKNDWNGGFSMKCCISLFVENATNYLKNEAVKSCKELKNEIYSWFCHQDLFIYLICLIDFTEWHSLTHVI